jgi:hypothetical protein
MDLRRSNEEAHLVKGASPPNPAAAADRGDRLASLFIEHAGQLQTSCNGSRGGMRNV